MRFTPVLWIFLLVGTVAARGGGQRKPVLPTDDEINALEEGQIIAHYSAYMYSEKDPVPYFPVIFMGHIKLDDGSNSNELDVALFSGQIAHLNPPEWVDFRRYFPHDIGKIVNYRTKKFMLCGKVSLQMKKTRRDLIRIPPKDKVILDVKQLEEDMLLYYQHQIQNDHGQVDETHEQAVEANEPPSTDFDQAVLVTPHSTPQSYATTRRKSL